MIKRRSEKNNPSHIVKLFWYSTCCTLPPALLIYIYLISIYNIIHYDMSIYGLCWILFIRDVYFRTSRRVVWRYNLYESEFQKKKGEYWNSYIKNNSPGECCQSYSGWCRLEEYLTSNETHFTWDAIGVVR